MNLAAHLDAALADDEGFIDPFRVFYFKPFPNELYAELITTLPPDEAYHDLIHEDAMRSDGTSTRKVLDLKDAPTVELCSLGQVLCSWSVEEAFRKHVGFEGPVTAVARLFRDFDGYKILPHTDSSKKACTVQFYLARDWARPNLGTTFYDARMRKIHTLPFLPNTGYCFKVTDHSWHGVELKSMTQPRNSLILTYYYAHG